MASILKSAAVAVAMSKCPFLSGEVMRFAKFGTSAALSKLAMKCPVMSQLMVKVCMGAQAGVGRGRLNCTDIG